MEQRLRSFSHVALNVGPGEGPLAQRLLEHFGLAVTDNGPSGRGEPWYTALIDSDTYGGGLDHLGFFVVPASAEQLALEAAITAGCGDERDAYRAEKLHKPDSNGHIAITFGGVDALEDAVLALAADDELAGRCTIRQLRPESAPPSLEERLDRSAVFADAERVRYLSDGVQVFVITDVVSAGLLCLGQSFELNHSAR